MAFKLAMLEVHKYLFPVSDGVSVVFRFSAFVGDNGSSLEFSISVGVCVGCGTLNQALMLIVPCAASVLAVSFYLRILSFRGMFYQMLKNECN